VWFGFVAAETQESELQGMPWRDVEGNFVAEGALTPQLSAGYKRQGYMVSLWVRVPHGRRLVFRL
jgi:hypothetical protein